MQLLLNSYCKRKIKLKTFFMLTKYGLLTDAAHTSVEIFSVFANSFTPDALVMKGGKWNEEKND